MCSNGTPEENLAKMVRMTEEAARENVDFIMFPEYAYYSPLDLADAQKRMEDHNGRLITTFRELAAKYKINIQPGSFSEKVDGDMKPCNGTVFIDRKGEIIGSYRKIHLCDVLGADESEYVRAGNSITVVDADFGKVGLMICYDYRFPELPRSLALKGAQIITIPFENAPGNILPNRYSHMDILTRCVAIHNMTYVIACNQYGKLEENYLMGYSRVIDPWGDIVAQASAIEGPVYAYLDIEYQKEILKRLPSLTHRRPELYEL